MNSPKPRYLLFNPRDAEGQATSFEREGYEIVLAGTKLSDAFCAYDMTIMFAGSFEFVEQGRYVPRVRYDAAQLDRRTLEATTALEQGRPLIFLVPALSRMGSADSDLFRRMMTRLGVHWQNSQRADPSPKVTADEFAKFIRTHGSASVIFGLPKETEAKVLATTTQDVPVSFAMQNVFCLPTHEPTSGDEAIQMLELALEAVATYLSGRSAQLPTWIAQMSIGIESKLREDARQLQAELHEIESKLEAYREIKAILCLKGEPLVKTVNSLFSTRLDLPLRSEDSKIEDLSLVRDGNVVAIFEVKGVNRNFQRNDINQVDNHRERLSLPSTIPGLLIMNTFASAVHLEQKSEPPHPDLISKAESDNVLLIRTLDLLDMVDLVENQLVTLESLHEMLFSGGGWLRVVDNTPVKVVS